RFNDLVQVELYKVFRKPRTYIAFAAITAIVSVIQLGFYADGKSYMQFGMQSLSDTFEVQGNILNGYLMTYLILQLLLVHVPLLIVLVSGDMVSGEAAHGTLRLLLTKPISRTKLLMGKFTAAFIYTMMLLLWMAIWALGLSLIIFGADDMLILKSEVVTQIVSTDILWRYLCAFGYAALAMTTVAALGFLLSIFADNSIGPIIATMSIIIVFTILNSLDLPFFNSMKHYLFTSHMLGWKGFFDVKLNEDNQQIVGSIENLPAILNSALVLFAHIIGFLALAFLSFRKKDVLS
ncbi:MAG: ABC transporter permease, partial [Chitinophagaceae bacterium]